MLKRIVNKEAELILFQVLDNAAMANVDNHKWEYAVAKNKIDKLWNNTAEFSNTMKIDSIINWKIQASCEGKEAKVTKTSSTKNVTMPADTNNTVLVEYHQLVLDEIY